MAELLAQRQDENNHRKELVNLLGEFLKVFPSNTGLSQSSQPSQFGETKPVRQLRRKKKPRSESVQPVISSADVITPLVEATDTQQVQAVVQNVIQTTFKAPPNQQGEVMEWLLSGAHDDDGVDRRWYIKRLLTGDDRVTTDKMLKMVEREGINISRASIGRFLLSLRKREYNNYIVQRCQERAIALTDVFPGENPVAQFKGNAWVVVDSG